MEEVVAAVMIFEREKVAVEVVVVVVIRLMLFV